MISIHASAKEATKQMTELIVKMDFNPRLREGGDYYMDIKGVVKRYFNPRLREGGDNTSGILASISSNFNPRLREGGDQTRADI